jgi:hypothetical protein
MFDKYERKVYDILTYLGDIGGLTEALISIGSLIVGFFTQKLFMSKIVRKIYHIRKYDNIEHESLARLNKDKEDVVGRMGPGGDPEGSRGNNNVQQD